MEKTHFLLTPSASLIMTTPIASAENAGQNDESSVTGHQADEWSAKSQEKTSKKEPAPTQKVAAATDIDASVA